MQNDRNWFLMERSVAFTTLLLTARTDVSVQSKFEQDGGVAFLVSLVDGSENVPSTGWFVVQARGTMSEDKCEWTKDVEQLYLHADDLYQPACVFLFNVKNNTARYAWIAEPVAGGSGARLMFSPHPEFHPLDKRAVDGIVQRVREWYDAIPRIAAPHSN